MCLFTSVRTVAIVFARSAGSEAMYCAGVLTFDGGFMDLSSSRTKCISERLKISQPAASIQTKSKIRVSALAVSLDGYAAGPRQSLDDPLGVRGPELFEWFFSTRTWKQMHGQEGGSSGVDNQ